MKDLKNLFIPCEENKFKPDFLERASIGVMLVLILLSFAIANIQSLIWIGSDWMVSTILPAVIVDLTNDERSGEKLNLLKRSDVLDAAAKLKAEDMAENEYFAHNSPTGVTPWHWFDQVSYNFIYAGENLAVHFTDSSEVVEAWMKSPLHRENIMNGTYAEIGVGTAKGMYKGVPTIFVVQLFGTLSSIPKASAEVVVVPPIVTEPIATTAPQTLATETNEEGNVLSENIAVEENEIAALDLVASANTSDVYTFSEASAQEAPVPAEEPVEVYETFVTEGTNNTSVMYSDLATTSRLGAPGFMEIFDEGSSKSGGTTELNPLTQTMTQSGLWLQIVYAILAFVVVFALLLSILVEWRRQHPIQIVYAGGLLAVMALLFHVHTLLTHGVLIV